MGISYQTRNRLRRKVHTAPLVAPSSPVLEVPSAPRRNAWWPLASAGAVIATAFACLYRF
jgi:hypothetical protein